MKYEKTQKKNPHCITVNQHIFPLRSIRRFSDHNGTVEVKLINQNKIIYLPPGDPLFCARRCWDERAETGYMKKIEDSFQNLASKIINRKVLHLDEANSRSATEFFALWYLRAYRNSNPIQDVQLKGIAAGEQLTKDEEERLEKNHAVFARGKEVSVPGRFMNSINIQMGIDKMINQMGKLKWGIVTSMDGEFIVPETYSTLTVIPISPRMILLGDSMDLLISRSEVRKVNSKAISFCSTYYFARNLSHCPI